MPPPPRPGPAPGTRRLVRRTDDRVIAGVASGIAANLGIEPWIVRVGFIILVPFGGSGLLAYLLAWLLIPAAGSERSLAAEVLGRPSGLRSYIGVGLIVLAVAILASAFSEPVLIWAIALIAFGVFLFRQDPDQPDPRNPHPRTPSPPGTSSYPYPPAGPPERYEPTAHPPAGPPSTYDTAVLPALGSPGAGGTGVLPAAGPSGSGATVLPAADPPAAPPEATPSETTLPEAALHPPAPPEAALHPPGPVPGPPVGDRTAPGEEGYGAIHSPRTSPDPPVWAPPPQDLPVWTPPPHDPAAAWGTPPPRAPRRKPFLGPLTFAVALLVTALAIVLDNLGVVDLTAGQVLAVFLTVLGGGLLVGAWWGRAWGLIPVGLLAIPVVAVAALAGPVPVEGGFAERVFQPRTPAEVRSSYRLAGGEMILDLSDVRFGAGQPPIEASVAGGRLLVVVPDEVAAKLRGRVGVGSVDLLGHVDTGAQVDSTVTEPAAKPTAKGTAPTVELDLMAGYGVIEVRRASDPRPVHEVGPFENGLPAPTGPPTTVAEVP